MFSIPRAGLTCDAPIRAPLRLDRVIRSLSNSIFSRSDVDPRLFRYIRGNDGTLPLSSAYTAAVDGALGTYPVVCGAQLECFH